MAYSKSEFSHWSTNYTNDDGTFAFNPDYTLSPEQEHYENENDDTFTFKNPEQERFYNSLNEAARSRAMAMLKRIETPANFSARTGDIADYSQYDKDILYVLQFCQFLHKLGTKIQDLSLPNNNLNTNKPNLPLEKSSFASKKWSGSDEAQEEDEEIYHLPDNNWNDFNEEAEDIPTETPIKKEEVSVANEKKKPCVDLYYQLTSLINNPPLGYDDNGDPIPFTLESCFNMELFARAVIRELEDTIEYNRNELSEHRNPVWKAANQLIASASTFFYRMSSKNEEDINPSYFKTETIIMLEEFLTVSNNYLTPEEFAEGLSYDLDFGSVEQYMPSCKQ